MHRKQLICACLLVLAELICGQWHRNIRRPFRGQEFDYLDNQAPTRSSQCPMSSLCIFQSWCKEEIRGQPQNCGYTNNWQPKICCPVRTGRSRSTNPWTVPWGTRPSVSRYPEQPTHQTPPIYSPGRRDTKCGRPISKPAPRGFVIGGRNAEKGDWPWMVAFTIKKLRGALKCSGFLIDRQHVLSAAHCFEKGKRENYYSALIGHVNLKKSQEYDILRIHHHPDYKNGSFYNDIAVITLSRPVKGNNYNSICLPYSRQFINVTGMGTTIAGWGITDRAAGKTSQFLNELSGLEVVSNSNCSRSYRNAFAENYKRDFPNGITRGLLCAGILEEYGKATCKGDSGGPLMFEYSSQWYAIGIVSFDFRCGWPYLPGGFTRVSEYLDWIKKVRNDL
ncbi:hypothetical protein JTE90_001767 [Oedothorax gibbosus]|uniref:Peptidase S1 domain-containing protein n=1 Tax=Oedothorax gibbosus TaxID=931172 RepID=A0AAV6VQF4_9ARAC|nr:hypothetical protein JTE90_001767 [Oedothorax gibbosus]